MLQIGFSRERKILRDGGRQRGLTMVDVTDGPDNYVRFGSLKLLLSHGGFILLKI
jgi:hypothetical protein